MWHAAWGGSVDILRELVKLGVSKFRADKNGITPLMAACMEGHLPAAEYLKSKGCDVERTNKYDGACTHLAAAAGHHHILVWLVTREGARVGRPNAAGETELIIASYRGHFSCVEFLANRITDRETAPRWCRPFDPRASSAIASPCAPRG